MMKQSCSSFSEATVVGSVGKQDCCLFWSVFGRRFRLNIMHYRASMILCTTRKTHGVTKESMVEEMGHHVTDIHLDAWAHDQLYMLLHTSSNLRIIASKHRRLVYRPRTHVDLEEAATCM